MPRARNIKPGFFKDAKVVSCSYPARLCFVGLWCLADYSGRLKRVDLEIKMELFPGDNIDVSPLVDELARVGLIDIYPGPCGCQIIHIYNFDKHQNPHKNERFDTKGLSMPVLPSRDDMAGYDAETDQIPEDYQRTTRGLPEDTVSPLGCVENIVGSIGLIPDSLLLIPDSNTRHGQEGTSTLLTTKYIRGGLKIAENGDILE